MFMDFGPQKPGEHDFDYAARILKAAGTKFEAMLANGAYSLVDLRELRRHIMGVVEKEIDPQLVERPTLRTLQG